MAAITALGVVVVIMHPTSLTLGTAIAALFANQAGGIAPDIDQPTAPFWRNLPIGGFFGRITGSLLGGHRFLSHSIIGVIAAGGIIKLFLTTIQPIAPHIDMGYVWWAFMIGYLSHLVTDSLTKEGVPWLLPLPFKFGVPPIRRLRFKTGGKAELWLVLPGLFGGVVWLCAHYYAIFSHVIK